MAAGAAAAPGSRERWVVNKVRALGSWYTKGFENGSHLRTAINSAESVRELRELIAAFFLTPETPERQAAAPVPGRA